MPEGHLLHRLARDQAELARRTVRVTSPQGRSAAGAAAKDGRRLRAWRPTEDGRIISAPLPAAERPTVADGRMVYKQAGCRRCGTRVKPWELAGRTAYACPRCQPR